jgi:hypothetical protein
LNDPVKALGESPEFRSFVDLFEGKIDKLLIAVRIDHTRANFDDCLDGVYEMTHQEFVKICVIAASLDNDEARRQGIVGTVTPQSVAQSCDDFGLADPWFSQSHEVAVWIESKKPVMPLDGFVS